MRYLIALLILFLFSCKTGTEVEKESPASVKEQNNRFFQTSFESIAEFNPFYIVPQGDYDSNHELSSEEVKTGTFAHKAWITDKRADDNDGSGAEYKPHRAYPTIQLHKTAMGSFVTPCLISFYSYLDINLTQRGTGKIDDWFSFATLSPDTSDNWARTVVVNITPDGYLRLVHVPTQGSQTHIFQSSAQNDNGSLLYPYREWVRIDIFIHFAETAGYAKVWQNGKLVSHALVEGGNGTLAQTHFGLYASAAIEGGTIYNDDLTIREVKTETEAISFIFPN